MIVQLAGLPATGKSTLAAGLQRHYGRRCLLLEKDRVRAALYGYDGQVRYEREQDDFVASLLYRTATEWLSNDRTAMVVLERTGTRAYQIADVVSLAQATGQTLAVIHCWCPDEVARERLDADLRRGGHPSANRTFELYRHLKQTADPITVPALRLSTDSATDDVLAAAVDYLDRQAATDWASQTGDDLAVVTPATGNGGR